MILFRNLVFAAGWLMLAGAPCGVAAEEGRSYQDVARFAAQQVARLQQLGEMVDRRNIPRYFATYPLPPDEAQVKRILGTAQRIMHSFARKLYASAHELAVQHKATVIEVNQIDEIVNRLLPSEKTPYKTLVFFPQAQSSVHVELIDLQAFQDTPVTWHALSGFILPDQGLPFAGSEAIARFSQAVGWYGLLLFRMGAENARQTLAPALASPHLRQAQKAIARPSHSPVAAEQKVSRPPGSENVHSYFADVTDASGIRFRHVSSDWISRFRRYGPLAPTFSGGGVTAGDIDGDTWPDLIYCGGEGCVAFGNKRDGTFEDITSSTALNVSGEARMSIAADFSNDGYQDVFITYARDTNKLFANRGNGRFVDVTDASGLQRDGDISGPVIAFDYNNDGLLDIYVGNFGDYLNGASPWIAPDAQNALPNRLYRNLGDLRFEDVTGPAGTGNTGWTQALSHIDYDRDGDEDIYVANDFGSNELLENRGDGTFVSVAQELGADDPLDGMNVAFADFNRDAHADILISNIWGWFPGDREPREYNTLLVSVVDAGTIAYEPGLRRVIPDMIRHDTGWAWAALFFDIDNDGDDDLFMTNGLTDYSTAWQHRRHPDRRDWYYPVSHIGESNMLFRNDEGVLMIPPESNGAELSGRNSRALALLDYDCDGDLDMAVSTFHSKASLFRNDVANEEANNWIQIELVGDPEEGVNRDAIGAQLIVRDSSGLYVWRAVTGGEGYLGMSNLPVDIGLGAAMAVDIEIDWPGMQHQRHRNVAANQRIRIHQADQVLEPW